MKIYEIQNREPLLNTLLEIWEDSVRATHKFLSDAEINQIKEYVPMALKNVEHLLIAENEPGVPAGFMGIENHRLEMLFLSSGERGKGLGRQMLQYGIKNYAVRELTVNEQNPQAAGFYRHMGFETYKRTECDEEGNPYPLLYMKLIETDRESKGERMNDRWLDFAIRIQSIAQAGLQYGKDKYDKERYEELRKISAEMISAKTDISVDKVYNLFCNETGYQTPKVDTRAAIFIEGRILLVHENNGSWSLPGGWCDVDQSIASNTIKEVKEETGFTVSAQKLIAVQDWRKHNVTNFAYGVVKVFLMCKYESGKFEENIETTEIALFGKDEIPEALAVEKCTREQILMCFKAFENPNSPTLFE